MIASCFSVSASVLEGKFLYSSSSEKYSVFKYLAFLFVFARSISSSGFVGASVMLAMGGGGFEGFLFVVEDFEETVELAVLGLDDFDAVEGREEALEEGREEEERMLGVGLRADTRLRRVLGVVGRDLVR